MITSMESSWAVESNRVVISFVESLYAFISSSTLTGGRLISNVSFLGSNPG